MTTQRQKPKPLPPTGKDGNRVLPVYIRVRPRDGRGFWYWFALLVLWFVLWVLIY